MRRRCSDLRGSTWTRALPNGYMLSLLGFVIFALGGGVDFAWHSLFGFEADEEALLRSEGLDLDARTAQRLYALAAWFRDLRARWWRGFRLALAIWVRG